MTTLDSQHPAHAPVALSALERAGETLFRLRDYTPIPILILAFLFANPTWISLGVGLAVALVGEAVRTYGVAFIGTISRTRSYSNGELTQNGPFSLLRNPLYFGNLVLSLGLSLMPAVVWLPFLVVALFYLQYIPIVAWEEMKLRRIFAERYEAYCQAVPNRWFPALGALLKGQWFERPESWGPALRSERRTLTSFVVYTGLMGLILYLKLTHQVALPFAESVFR